MKVDFYVFITVGGVEVANIRKKVVAAFDERVKLYSYDVVNVRRSGMKGKAMRMTVFDVTSHIMMRSLAQGVATDVNTTVMTTSPFGNFTVKGSPQCPDV